MRPSAVTAAASVSTAPAPPTARLPRWTMCQSLAAPSRLEYSHIGDTAMRLRSVTPRIVSGLNSEEAIPHDIMNRMLMASRTMAARIERAECETVLAFAERLQANGTEVMIREIAGAAAVFAGPGQPINKLAGLGFSGPVAADALGAIEREYDERGAELRVELATLADPSVGKLLTGRGYELAGYENVLGLPLDGDLIDGLTLAREADAGPGLVVSPVGPDETRLWIETVADGFSAPDQFDGPPPTESFERDAI